MKRKELTKKILAVALSLTVAFTSLVVFDGTNAKKASAAGTTSQNTLTATKGSAEKTQIGVLATSDVGNGMRRATASPTNVQATQIDYSGIDISVGQSGRYWLEVYIGGKWYDAGTYYNKLNGMAPLGYGYDINLTANTSKLVVPFSQTFGYWKPGMSITFRYGLDYAGSKSRGYNLSTGEITSPLYYTTSATWKIVKGNAKIYSVAATKYYRSYSYYYFYKTFKASNYGISSIYIQYKSGKTWKNLTSIKNTDVSMMDRDKSCYYYSNNLKTNYYFRIYIPAGTYNNQAVFNFTSNPKDMSPRIYTKVSKSTRYIYYYSYCPKGSLRIYYKSGKKYHKIKTLTCTRSTKKWRLPYKYRKYIGKLYCNYDPSSSYKYYSNPGALRVKYL
ncbi:MAG: hypothetical protein LBM02_05055 [Lachnospiraceae bacterium]|jgi:hypothetical protein|nr:hypothetical protein [Lachnospiraceae bacterium]